MSWRSWAYLAVIVGGAFWATYMALSWPAAQRSPFYVALGGLVLTALVLPGRRKIEDQLEAHQAARNALLVLVAAVVVGVPTVYSLFPYELTDLGRQLDVRVSVMEGWVVVASLALARTALGDQKVESRDEARELEEKLREAIQSVGNANPRTGIVGLHWYVLTRRRPGALTVAYPLVSGATGAGQVVAAPSLPVDAVATKEAARVSPPDPGRMRAGDLLLFPTAAAGIACPVVNSRGLALGAVVAYADHGKSWKPGLVETRVRDVAKFVVSDVERGLRGLK